MRFVKIPLLWLVLVAAVAAPGWAQDKVIGCDDLIKSSFDELRIRFNEGPADQIALIPVSLHHDSICTAFQFLIQYDTSLMTPVYQRDSTCAISDSESNCLEWNVDTTYVDNIVNGRFVKTEVTQGPFGPIVDTVTKFRANLFQGHRDIVACNFLPNFSDIDSLAPPNPNVSGNDTIPIFYLKFHIKPGVADKTLCEFTFYEYNIWLYCDTCNNGLGDSTQVPGCNESQMTTIWKVADSSVTYQIYPQTDFGYSYYYRVNNDVTPSPTVTLTVNPTSITEGSNATLSWNSDNSDSVVVRRGTTRVSGTQNDVPGSFLLSGLSEGTYTYVATAYGSSKTATDDAVLIVNEQGEGPVLTVSAVESSYDQGELVSFTVTATNTNSSQITLRGTSLPSNASFGISGQVIGMSPLVGVFSWTPDFNQDGQFVIAFQGTDNGGTTYKNVFLTINELQYDRLFSTSAKGSNPVGGLPGTGGIRFPIDLITATTVYGVQFDMTYPSADIRIDSVVASPRIPAEPDNWYVDCIGQTPGAVRVLAFGTSGVPLRDTNTTAILYAFMTIDNDADPWSDCEIILSNGRESVTPNPNFGGQPLVTDTGVVEVDRHGDVNLDRYVDVADAVNIVAYIIGTYGLTPRQFATADIATNDSVNVFDLVADINLIYNIDAVPSPAPAPDGKASVTLAYDDLSIGSSDNLMVASELPTAVAGAQFEINYDPSAVTLGAPVLTSAVAKFALRSNDDGNGHMKILLYNMAPFKTEGLAQAGLADLVEVPITARRNLKSGDKAAIRLTQALLSTSDAATITVTGVDTPLPTGFALSQNYPNPFNPTTTIEYTVGVGDSFNVAQHVQLDIYNVLGQHVSTLVDGPQPAGEYQVEWNATDKTGQRVATGIYLYRLNVGNESVTKKMLFLK